MRDRMVSRRHTMTMKTNKIKIKRFVLTNIPYFIVAYAGNLICFAFRTAEGETVSDKIIPAIENIGPTLAHILPSMNLYDIIIGAAAGGVTKAQADHRCLFHPERQYDPWQRACARY